MLSPEKELEAWALADHAAVKVALGVNTIPQGLMPDTPIAAEKLSDPKARLDAVIRSVTNRRSSARNILVRIAQEQSIDELRRANSFQVFEDGLRNALDYAGFLQ